LRLEDFRGKYAVVVFYPLNVERRGTSYADLLRDGWGPLGRDDRVRLLVVGPAPGPQTLRDYQARHPLPGAWGYLESRPGKRNQTMVDYGVDSVPQVFLVGPDGTVLARSQDIKGISSLAAGWVK